MSEDEWAPYADPDTAMRKAEDDLRIRMFALDMAVTALPNLITAVEDLNLKLDTVRLAAEQFEKILRGDEVA